MAGETGTQGSEFPIFKSEEGAFDRAKYKEQEAATFESDGINVRLTGKEIDEDLKKKKKSADDAIKEANKFYGNEFNKNLKALDPAYDPKLIYYSEAYSDGGSSKNKIRRKIEKGEAVDGKEISEMSKQSAENKIGNAQKLKTGSVTQIVENLGLKNIKEFDLYGDVKSDFDSKVKDEKLKFDPLLKKFSDIIGYFNDGGPMTDQKYKILFTPENNSIIAALAKILEEQGFDSESVLAMAKRYDDNLGKLIDKSKSGSIESMEMTKEGDVVKKGEGVTEEKKLEEKKESVTEEKKLEEKKEEAPAATLPPPAAPVEEPKVAPVEPVVETKSPTPEPALPATASTETKLEESKNTTKPAGSTEPTVPTASIVKTESPKLEKSLDDKYNSVVKDLFGIDLGATVGTGGTKGTGKAETEAEKLATKKADDLFGSLKGGTNSTGGTENKGVEKKNEEIKLENKIDKKNKEVNETLPISASKIETETQNLLSVSTPVEKPKEPESTPTNTTDITNSNTGSNTDSSESTTTEAPKSEITNNEKKIEGNKTEGDGNKEMLDTMKTISSLLIQLNSTMQGPLIVTPTNKKFQ